MAAELSPELRRALSAAPDAPLELIDPDTQRVYVLLSAAAYERVQALLGQEDNALREMQRLLADLAPEDWEDAANYEQPQP